MNEGKKTVKICHDCGRRAYQVSYVCPHCGSDYVQCCSREPQLRAHQRKLFKWLLNSKSKNAAKTRDDLGPERCESLRKEFNL